jgi:hypothetical protein
MWTRCSTGCVRLGLLVLMGAVGGCRRPVAAVQPLPLPPAGGSYSAANGNLAGLPHRDSKRTIRNADVVLDERDVTQPDPGHRRRCCRGHNGRHPRRLDELHDHGRRTCGRH